MVLPGTLPAENAPAQPPAPSRRFWPLAIGMAGAAVAVVLVVRLFLIAVGDHSYAFLAMQGDNPVTWNHCQAIRYQVNPKGAPENWEQIVHRAVRDVQDASGFVFADRGTTVKTDLIGAGRYDGNEWEPVLIVWKDRYQDQSLDGTIAGRGGSRTLEVNGTLRFVIGKVTLDANVTDEKVTRLVLEHELGHVLGLDHTENPGQLMYAAYHGQDGLGRGDIAGLKRLHEVPCD